MKHFPSIITYLGLINYDFEELNETNHFSKNKFTMFKEKLKR